MPAALFQVPVTAGIITSPYGPRIHPITKEDSFHYGVDIAGKEGDVILAARDGVIQEVGENPIRGKFVVLRHPDGTQSLYEHLSRVLIPKPGLKVFARMALANMGSTGRSTGPHLHFEVRDKNGQPVDPGPLLGLVMPAKGEKIHNVPLVPAALVVAGAVALWLALKGI